MLFQNNPHRKQIAIGAGILLVVGLVIYNSDTRYEYSASHSITPPSEMQMAFDDSIGGVAMEEMALVDDTSMRKSSGFVPEPVQNGSVAADVAQEDRLIIKNGSMSLVVDDVAIAVDQVNQFVLKQGGFVVTSNIEKSGIRPSGFVTVRIPSKIFDTGLDTLRALGEVKSERVDGRDVTEEFVDVEAQVENLRATEKQFLAIMNRAVEIKDVLAVQRELSNVRSQIERLEGRMKYLKESAAFSSLTVYLSSDPEDLPILDDNDTWKPLATAKDAVRELLYMGTSVLDALIWFVVYIPLWIGLFIAFVLGRKVYRKRQQ